MLDHFGQRLAAGACNKGCDWCRHPDLVQQQVGLTACVLVNALTVTWLVLKRHRHLVVVIRAPNSSCMSHSWEPWRLMPWQWHRPAAPGLVEFNHQHVAERVTPFHLGRMTTPQRGAVLKASTAVAFDPARPYGWDGQHIAGTCSRGPQVVLEHTAAACDCC